MESVSSFGASGVSLTRHVLETVWSLVGWGVSLTRPVLESISLFGGWGDSLTRPVLESVRRVRSLCIILPILESADFLLQTPSWKLSGLTYI